MAGARACAGGLDGDGGAAAASVLSPESAVSLGVGGFSAATGDGGGEATGGGGGPPAVTDGAIGGGAEAATAGAGAELLGDAADAAEPALDEATGAGPAALDCEGPSGASPVASDFALLPPPAGAGWLDCGEAAGAGAGADDGADGCTAG